MPAGREGRFEARSSFVRDAEAHTPKAPAHPRAGAAASGSAGAEERVCAGISRPRCPP